jgi:ankyrin repeat protein
VRLPIYYNRRISKRVNRKQSIFSIAVFLVVLAWSSLAFCGEIHDAAAAGDLEKVKALLKANPDLVFSKDNQGNTPLHRAVYGQQLNVAKLLLHDKAAVDATNNEGDTPLHIVVAMQLATMFNSSMTPDWKSNEWKGTYQNIAKLLLANKADINAKDKSGMTPLHIAITLNFGNKEAVKFLLANNADVNAKNINGDTPLIFAVALGDDEIVERLLAHKADVNAKDNDGRTALSVTALYKDKKVAEKVTELLRQYGARE